MKPLVLDTHIFLWYINQQKELPKRILTDIEKSPKLVVSAISCYEVAWLCHHQRITLPNNWNYQQWFEFVEKNTDILFTDVTPKIAQIAVELPQHHKDPHDRMIIATSLHYDYYLASVDGKFLLYEELSTRLIR